MVHGDLTQLGCDAWLLPCDVRAQPVRRWLAGFGDRVGDPRWPASTLEWMNGTVRAMKVDAWPDDLPRPWLANVGAGSSVEVSWFIAGAEDFLRRVADDLAASGAPPRHGRAKHLGALPGVGTGYGGARRRAGDVVRELIPLLRRHAEQRDLDIALVTNEELTFAAAQAQRGTSRRDWPELSDALWAASDRLAALASDGDLVLFLGAGVSMSAGLPSWGGLLGDLAREAGMNPRELVGLGRLHPLDQARLIEIRLERTAAPAVAGRRLGKAIARAFKATAGYPLTHALLAALPVGEVVTTNYDELFERASRAIGKEVSVLPHAPTAGPHRWLLKMHGCVTDPDHIVLTREDYLRYDQRRQALAGIVQALLMMRHMLFVGFSLKDDNFHRIADAVRRARSPSPTPGHGPTSMDRFGTAIDLFADPMAQALWSSDLDWVTTSDEAPPERDDAAAQSLRAESARRLTILLDATLAKTGTTAHLLDERYEGALSDAERALGGQLRALTAAVGGDPLAAQATAWRSIEAMLRRLGWTGKR
jgi:hypothetical protein